MMYHDASMIEDNKPRIADIALLAGVGTATVDRVMNGRARVKPATKARVLAAIADLAASGGRPKVLTPPPSGLKLRAFLGGPPGFANETLGRALRDEARAQGLALTLDFVKRTDAVTQAALLRACLEDGTRGVILQPPEHPLIRDAVQDLRANGVPTLCLLTALPGLDALPYVGLDNRAAGRLAGQILGNLLGKRGKIGLFYSNSIYRSHEEREAGLRSILREDFPEVEIVETISTNDTPDDCLEKARDLLARRPTLDGIINLAAGNRGIERAVIDAGRARDLVFVAFNLTALSRKALIDGVMDAVIHQDMSAIARQALQALIAHHRAEPLKLRPIPAELILRENIRDIGPSF